MSTLSKENGIDGDFFDYDLYAKNCYLRSDYSI